MRGAGLKKKIQLFFGDKVFSVMFLLTVLFIFLAVISVIIPVKDKAEYVINTKQTTTVGEIYDGKNLSLSFHSSRPDLLGISFSFATYSRVLTDGSLTVTVTDEAQNVIYSDKMEGSSIQDNGSLDIVFPVQSQSANRNYTVLFTTSGINRDHAITLWANESSVSGVSTRLDGVILKTTPVFSLAYIANSFKYTWYLVLLFTFFFVLTVVSYKRNGPIE